MHDTNTLQQRIAQALATLHTPLQPENLYTPTHYMLQIGGKRIRPLLTLMAADLFEIDDMDKAVPAALAIELFHNFSLVHDDIMDNAPLRRGQQTVHQKWDGNIAILSGDNLLIMAYAQLAQCDPSKLPLLMKAFNTMATEVCEGQQLDMDFENSDTVSIDEYIHMIRQKTSVLLGTALKLGGVLSDAIETDCQLIYDFGVNIGLAFQLQDDMLDVYGDPQRIGKQRGGDILANKKSYLLLKAFELADVDTKAKLVHWLADESQPSEKIDQVIAIYNKLGLQTVVGDTKRHYLNEAFKAINAIAIPENRKIPLKDLAHNLIKRQH